MIRNINCRWGLSKKRLQDTLYLNNVPVARIYCSGSWGYGIEFLDKTIPKSINKYYQKRETAIRNTEKRFGIYPLN